MIYSFILLALWHSFHGLQAISNDYIHEKSLCNFVNHFSFTVHTLAFLTLFSL